MYVPNSENFAASGGIRLKRREDGLETGLLLAALCDNVFFGVCLRKKRGYAGK